MLVARRIGHAETRSKTLRQVYEEQIDHVTPKMLEASTFEPADKSALYMALAVRQARRGNYRNARQLSDRCLTPTERLYVYAEVLFDDARRRNPSLTSATSDRAQNPLMGGIAVQKMKR